MGFNLLLALCSSLLLTCAFSPIQFNILAYVALVPFFYLIERTSARGAIFWGYLTGFLISSVMVQWTSLPSKGDTFILMFVGPFYLSTYALAHHALLKKSQWVVIALIPLLWGLKEILELLTNLGLWMTSLGSTQAGFLTTFGEHFYLAGPIIAMWVALLNGLLFYLCKFFMRRGSIAALISVLALVFAVSGGRQWLH